MAATALRVAFGLIWVVDAAFTWTPDFAIHYVGYLHNAAQGQPGWSAWWFDFWIGLVTPHATLFIWLTRIIETLLALALLLGFARKTTYAAGALFSLLIWSTAEGFGGPYSVGATNMGAGIMYALLFLALIFISRTGPSPYSLDYHIEQVWPRWALIAEWRDARVPPTVSSVSWRVQTPALVGIALLVLFLVAGLHSSLHVSPATPAAAAAAVAPLSLASSTPIANARDARLPPAPAGSTVDVRISASDHTVEIASGVQYQAWTFDNRVPGPTIHVRQGQTVNVTFTNHGTMQHALDFHAAMTPPNLHYVDLQPGQSITYSFVARVPGAFLYHCGTAPVLLHIGNGMYGALIVDPARPLLAADDSYVLVQGEWYTQQVSGSLMGPSYEKMTAQRPDEVVFNGAAFQYRDHPLTATPGRRVRLYLVNAGPNLWSAFHVIGAMFDTVYPDGDPAHTLSGVSTYTVGPGEGAVLDLVIPDAGEYMFVDHAMAHAVIGAAGVLVVGTGTTTPSSAPATAAALAPTPAAVPLNPSGPYTFDAARGAALFTANCAACHQVTGVGLPGVFPSLVADPVVLNPDATKQIATTLHGLHGEKVGDVVYQTPMPPFATILNDFEIADIMNHERSSWGNRGKPVTADQVKAVRALPPAR
jgi:nitrite reductase (NO-forming)